MKDKGTWRGTATELCNELRTVDSKFTLDPINIKKKLTALSEFFKNEMGITVVFGRTRNSKIITFARE